MIASRHIMNEQRVDRFAHDRMMCRGSERPFKASEIIRNLPRYHDQIDQMIPTRANVFATAMPAGDRPHLSYPILVDVAPAGHLAIVAVVRATCSWIEFSINTNNALPITRDELRSADSWRTRFEMKCRGGLNVRGTAKGWTEAIIQVALQQHQYRYRYPPDWMAAFLDGVNLKCFWSEFARLMPGKIMKDLPLLRRVAIASKCIQKTPFWKPRKKLGYTRLMLETDALAHGLVFVRAFRDDIDDAGIHRIVGTAKTNTGNPSRNSWMLAPT